MREELLKDDGTFDVLKLMAPGTPLREGLENIQRARTGALIVVGDSEETMDIVDGGFFINKEYSPAHLYELAKMDGAIILSKDLKRILYANALLIPDPSIPTEETGTRHKSAQRFAKQADELVISISQRRNIITVYKGSQKYVLRDTPTILTRANQAIQTLEKYKTVLDRVMNNLSILEFEDMVTLDDVAVVLQRTEMVMRVVAEIERYICELGNEGRLVSMQLEELLVNIEDNGLLVIEDYMSYDGDKTPDEVLQLIRQLKYDEIMDLSYICNALGYQDKEAAFDTNVSPKGYRILSRIPRLPMSIVRKMVGAFGDLQKVIKATIKQLDDVEGIGEVRAKMIKEGLKRIREQVMLDNRRT